MAAWLWGIWTKLISQLRSCVCGWGGGCGGIMGWLTVLNLFRVGWQRAERCERTEMYPLSKNGTPGGRKWAGGLWSWTLVSALGRFHRSIRLKTAGNGARGPLRACKPRIPIMRRRRREESAGYQTPLLVSPSQTYQVDWLHPNKETDGSLVHKKPDRRVFSYSL